MAMLPASLLHPLCVGCMTTNAQNYTLRYRSTHRNFPFIPVILFFLHLIDLNCLILSTKHTDTKQFARLSLITQVNQNRCIVYVFKLIFSPKDMTKRDVQQGQVDRTAIIADYFPNHNQTDTMLSVTGLNSNRVLVTEQRLITSAVSCLS